MVLADSSQYSCITRIAVSFSLFSTGSGFLFEELMLIVAALSPQTLLRGNGRLAKMSIGFFCDIVLKSRKEIFLPIQYYRQRICEIVWPPVRPWMSDVLITRDLLLRTMVPFSSRRPYEGYLYCSAQGLLIQPGISFLFFKICNPILQYTIYLKMTYIISKS